MSFLIGKERRVSISKWPKSKTEQHHIADTHLPSIMIRYGEPAVYEMAAQRITGQYADLTGAPDFQEAQNCLAKARTEFEKIPAEIRAQFHNDPTWFADFASDPENKEALMELGFDASYLPDPVATLPVEDIAAPPLTTEPAAPTLEE